MIKIGKLQINNKISIRIWLILMIFSFVLLIVFSVTFISILIGTKDYVKIEALITNTGSDITYEDGGNIYNYVTIQYEYNNKLYEQKQRVIFRFNKKIGDNYNIYVNSYDAYKIRDNYMFNISLILAIFCLILFIFFIKCIIIKKNMI